MSGSPAGGPLFVSFFRGLEYHVVMASARDFPSDFLFGASTSAHQVEGNNVASDWWLWERSRARRVELERRGLDPLDFISGEACDHSRRFEEDFAWAKHFGHNAHRFSIEWAKCEPEEGTFNQAAFDHYGAVLEALQRRGIVPIVTLWHFTLPAWLSSRGGWEAPDAIRAFSRFVGRVVHDFAGQVRWWVTMDEPTVYAWKAYAKGEWPPQVRSSARTQTVLGRLLEAHRKAYEIIKFIDPVSAVGIAHHLTAIEPARPYSFFDALAARAARSVAVNRPIAATLATSDFIGVNYYSRRRVRFSLTRPADWFITTEPSVFATSDLGREIYPEGLLRALRELARHLKPILVTENGIADAADTYRARFIVEHLRCVKQALDEAIDVRGYLHWSLLDNFEWADGFGPRFGLLAVNYANQQRTPRPSAEIYAEICRTGRLPAP
ncbi:glycoside hydrolase family 1 protein [Candidatus Parcubacteria bacterium]|nr:glycoside hydrolase family 1 protein [Candidatus Parcubacteria bacterium]